MDACKYKNELDKYRQRSCSCDYCDYYDVDPHFPEAVAEIDKYIMLELIDEGFVVKGYD